MANAVNRRISVGTEFNASSTSTSNASLNVSYDKWGTRD